MDGDSQQPYDLPPAPPEASLTPTRPRPKVKRRQPRSRLPALVIMLISLMALMTVIGVTIPQGAYAALFGRATALATAQPTDTATPWPTATPVPLSLNQQHALHDGCVNGSPKPQKSVISGALPPGGKAKPPREVALTFDDGPTPYSTPAILTYLEKTHTPATFFVEGKFAAIWPDLLRREWRDGFAIGLHTWDHPNLELTPPSQFPHEFGDALGAIHNALGKDACVWLFRPPYGAVNGAVLHAAQSYGLTSVNWDASGLDWTLPGPDKIAQLVLQLSGPGAIILLHDGPAGREQTLQALPQILAGFQREGFKLVPLPKLLADAHFPGVDVPDYPIPDPTILPVGP